MRTMNLYVQKHSKMSVNRQNLRRIHAEKPSYRERNRHLEVIPSNYRIFILYYFRFICVYVFFYYVFCTDILTELSLCCVRLSHFIIKFDLIDLNLGNDQWRN